MKKFCTALLTAAVLFSALSWPADGPSQHTQSHRRAELAFAQAPTPTLEPPVVDGPLVVLPADAEGGPGEWVIVAPVKVVGGAPKYWLGAGLTRVPIHQLLGIDPATVKGVVVKGAVPGRYQVWAWNARADVASEASLCTVTVTGAAPVPPGPVPPVPPGPTPPNPPDPASESPFAEAGLRVLVAFEPNNNDPKDTWVYGPSKAVRDWLNAHCVKDPTGQDKDAAGQVQADWRIWPWATSLEGTPVRKVFRDAWANKGPEKHDWIMIGDGKRGYSGPRPRTEAEALDLLKKFGGP